MRFRDKVVLVTGASRGIGSACVRRFANEGAKVVIHYLNAVNAAEDLAKSIRDEGGQVTLIQADLAEPPQIERLVDITCRLSAVLTFWLIMRALPQSVHLMQLSQKAFSINS